MAGEFYKHFEKMMDELNDAEEAALKAFPDEEEEIKGSFDAVEAATSHLDDILLALDKGGEIPDHFREYSD